ncbi:hypothetical protein EJ110_NYTH32874 [Nymphaea thermarum]|nr:hypothetical protein EJ110_NYTH32874 [Nymphaea thermarum]
MQAALLGCSIPSHFSPLLLLHPTCHQHHLSFSSPSMPRRIAFVNDSFCRIPDSSTSGVCRASQAVDFFPPVCPDIVVREARAEDCWEIAETHCSSFFPRYSFPFDLALRINRSVSLLAGLSLPVGHMKKCLVAVVGGSVDDSHLFGGVMDIKVFGFEGKFSFNRGYVAGILTIDTLADFLPRKGPLGQRRTGIAYISNVAVKQRERRKGIAKRLIAKAEEQARHWGCRSLALHCDVNNPAAVALYKAQGFRCIKVPDGANWPEPRSAASSEFHFMMKLLPVAPTATS